MDTNNPIEGLDIERNKDEQHDSNIDNFSKQLKNPQLFASVFDNQNEDLKNLFESFLGTLNKKQERALKKHIDDAQTADEIKGIIIENVYANQGYQIGNNALLETVNNKQDTTRIEKETAGNEERTIETSGGIEEIKSAIQARQSLIEVHPELATNTNENSELYKNTKNQLEQNGIINQLQQSGYDEQFIDQYILVQTTLQELKANPTTYSPDEISRFDRIVKKLNNSCNIPDTSLDSFSDKNIGNTRDELFNNDEGIGNKDLIKAKNSSINSRDYSDVFPEMENVDLVAYYGKFLGNDFQDLIQKYENDRDSLSEEEYNKLFDALDDVKEDINNKTKEFMEEMCITSQIKGMTMCLGGDFELNKSNEIEYKNDILTINSHINGTPFSVRHNTKGGNNRLQTLSYLTTTDNGFSLGGKYKDSPFIMPSNEQIFGSITASFQPSLENADTPEQYRELFEKNINKKINKIYEDTRFTHHYIENQIEGEKITENTIGIINKILSPDGSIGSEITKPSELYDFMELIDFNTNETTLDEKKSLNDSLNKIYELLSQNTLDPNQSKIILDYFGKDKVEIAKNKLKGQQNSERSTLDFFKLFINDTDGRNLGNKKIIRFDALHNILFNPSNEQGYILAQGRYNDILKNESNEVDDELDSALEKI